MFLLRFFRFITGYVIFTGTGGFPERFLNLCSLNNISIWDAKSSGGILSARTSISDYKKIRQCARRSGMKLKAIKKCGLPFIIRPYIKRKGLIAGAVISFIIVCLLSSCVWTVSVNGNEKYTDEQILALAEEYGVYPGAFRKNIDVKAIREDIKASVDGINWFTVYIDNTSASVEVLENIGENEILDLTTPCNIVSNIDGELLKLEVYTGEAALSPGNAVTTGDLLISGVVERADGSSDFVHARGNAVIRTKREITKTVPLKISGKLLQPNISKTLYIFSLEIPLGKTTDTDLCRTEKRMLQYNDITLPLGIISNRAVELSEEDINLNENMASLLCSYTAFMAEKDVMMNAETEQKEVSVHSDEDNIRITIQYINHEKCGIENYFDVENNYN